MADQPLKICQCLWTGNYGGIERVVSTLVEEQQKKHEVAVLFAKSGGPIADEMEEKGAHLHFLGLKSGFDLGRSKRLKAKKLFAQFDVVHIHAFNYVLLWAAIRSPAKVVFTIHSLTALRRKLSWRDRLNHLVLNRCLKKGIDLSTSVSNFSRRKLQEQFSGAKKMEVVPNAWRPMNFEKLPSRSKVREGLGISENDFVLLSYARIVASKRFHLLPETVALLKKDIPNIKVFILGDGPEKPALSNQIEELQLQENISLLPFGSPVFEFIQMADVALFPFHAETFGLVSLECMIMGKPPVVWQDGGGLAEVLQPVDNGSLVVEDAETAARLILKFYQNPEHLQALRAELIKRAQVFTPEGMAAQYEGLYRKLL